MRCGCFLVGERREREEAIGGKHTAISAFVNCSSQLIKHTIAEEQEESEIKRD